MRVGLRGFTRHRSRSIKIHPPARSLSKAGRGRQTAPRGGGLATRATTWLIRTYVLISYTLKTSVKSTPLLTHLINKTSYPFYL